MKKDVPVRHEDKEALRINKRFAMAHIEGVVVVYLRKAIGMLDPEVDKRQALEQAPRRYVQI